MDSKFNKFTDEYAGFVHSATSIDTDCRQEFNDQITPYLTAKRANEDSNDGRPFNYPNIYEFEKKRMYSFK